MKTKKKKRVRRLLIESPKRVCVRVFFLKIKTFLGWWKNSKKVPPVHLSIDRKLNADRCLLKTGHFSIFPVCLQRKLKGGERERVRERVDETRHDAGRPLVPSANLYPQNRFFPEVHVNNNGVVSLCSRSCKSITVIITRHTVIVVQPVVYAGTSVRVIRYGEQLLRINQCPL